MDNHSCEIEWNILLPDEWRHAFASLSRSNCLQSYAYAKAICPLHRQSARWGVIMMDGVRAGLVQILEAKALGGLLHALMLDRGPLWFDGYGNDAHFAAFLQALRKNFPKRWGRKIRFIPEVIESAHVSSLLEQNGFTKMDGSAYQTLWLNLEPSEETLQQSMRKNWRNMLSKAGRENIEIEWDDTGKNFPWLAKTYLLDKAQKDYDGLSAETLKSLAQNFAAEKSLLIARAIKDGKPCGAALFFLHGRAATYQIGWTSDGGRRIGAQNLLLWESILRLKKNGYTDLDLGGGNDAAAKNVQKFKEGLGGSLLVLPGLYH